MTYYVTTADFKFLIVLSFQSLPSQQHVPTPVPVESLQVLS